MNIYCVKCKKKTNTVNIKPSLSKTNKKMVKGNCTVCNKMKSCFVSKEQIKKGGFVFTLPAILAAVGAAGSLAGGAAGVATAVNKKKAADRMLEEQKRHNLALEKKSGTGIFLKPATGKGLRLKPYKS